MTGPSFDDTLDYWVDNPDERVIFDKTCPECPMTFDDRFEYRCHRFVRHGEIPDTPEGHAVMRAVNGLPTYDEGHAYEVWLEGSAA